MVEVSYIWIFTIYLIICGFKYINFVFLDYRLKPFKIFGSFIQNNDKKKTQFRGPEHEHLLAH